MKTEDLIRALVADTGRPVVPVSRTLGIAIASGAAATLVLFLTTLHPRPDLLVALRTPAFIFKLFLAVLLCSLASLSLPELARPTGTTRPLRLLLLVPAVLAAGLIFELWTQPPALWPTRLVGHNAVHCLSIIPFLSLMPAFALFLALRRAAPAQPVIAGAVAGLAAGGIGAFLYGLTCPDDSPLFVATWYSIAILVVTGLAAASGSRLLRW
jgi:hypothetical protein